IRDILHDHLFEDIGLKDISRMVGLDRYHIHRIFKSTFHLAPHQYLIQLRLTRARDLLARSISPAQVASDLCFSDQSHLSRWFKRCYELTPAAYRKICTNLQD
ncbi:AraC family transcriptional regulator, partial [Acinetobacter nosocomialis]